MKAKLTSKKYLIITVLLVGVVAMSSFAYYKNSMKNAIPEDVMNMVEAIKHTESEQPARIGKNPSEEEIHNSNYIKHIRVALNGYLDGSNFGVEEPALKESYEGMECGLSNFDKSYYKGKFVILEASDSNYGGVSADIVFIDKPDAIFWAWIYNLGDFETREANPNFVLRVFCKVGPDDKSKASFSEFIQTGLKNNEFPYFY